MFKIIASHHIHISQSNTHSTVLDYVLSCPINSLRYLMSSLNTLHFPQLFYSSIAPSTDEYNDINFTPNNESLFSPWAPLNTSDQENEFERTSLLVRFCLDHLLQFPSTKKDKIQLLRNVSTLNLSSLQSITLNESSKSLSAESSPSLSNSRPSKIDWLNSVEKILKQPFPNESFYIICDDTPKRGFERLTNQLDRVLFVSHGALGVLLYLRALLEDKQVVGFYSDWDMPVDAPYIPGCQGDQTIMSVAQLADIFNVDRPKLLIQTSATEDEVATVKSHLMNSHLFSDPNTEVPVLNKLFTLNRSELSQLFSFEKNHKKD